MLGYIGDVCMVSNKCRNICKEINIGAVALEGNECNDNEEFNME